MKKIYFDEEFTSLVQNTTLMSIGLVSECGRKFYAELTDYDNSLVSPWIEENVLSKFCLGDTPKTTKVCGNIEIVGDKKRVAEVLQEWLESFGEKLEMWSDCLAYDWVLFCDLFGGAFGVPECVYYIPFDLCTLFLIAGIDPDISREEFAGVGTVVKNGGLDRKHNALFDALVIKACCEKLTGTDEIA